ncbi:MAG: diaminopimelate epimerase [Christensenellales bacterium]
MHFTKMHGLGNDYLYVFGQVPDDIADLSIRLSERHFGAGSDGMIYISPSDIADFKMRIFNADGSEAKMCGNGIRCVGKYLYDKGYTDKRCLRIETLSGIRTLDLTIENGIVVSVSVDMGQAVCDKDVTLAPLGRQIVFTPVSVGNPHAVTFVDDVENFPVEKIGPVVEKDATFPGGVNVEFIQRLSSDHLRMRVWERGSGITMACGTGACASTAAAVSKGLVQANQWVRVTLDGGDLLIKIKNDGAVEMQGPAQFVYEGETI